MEENQNLPARKRPRKQNKKVTERDKQVFLDGLAQGMVIKKAAEAACHPYESFYYITRHDPEFAEAVHLAKEAGTDMIEAEAFRRGVEGFTKPVWGKVAPGIDGIIGEEIVYSDRLMEVLLKGRRHEYRDNPRVDITNQTLVVNAEDRTATIDAVARVLMDAGVRTLEATEGIADDRGVSYKELPES